MAGLIAYLQFTKVFEQHGGKWLVLGLAVLFIVLSVLAEVFLWIDLQHKEATQEARDADLVAKVIATYQRSINATQQPKQEAKALPAVTDNAQSGMTLDDPRIYLDIEPASEAIFPRTPFLLRNRGKYEAHNVVIQPFKLSRKLVTFPEVSVVAADAEAKSLPTIEKGNGETVKHDIFHWLVKDWNDSGGLADEEWPIDIVVTYSDPLGKKKFREAVTLMFYPIMHLMNKSSDDKGIPGFVLRHRESSWEFKNPHFSVVD